MRRLLLLTCLLTVACGPRPHPRPPPVQPPPVVTFAVEVLGTEGPLAGAVLTMADQTAITNGDGYAPLLVAPHVPLEAVVEAEGYLRWSETFVLDDNRQVQVALQKPPPITPWPGRLTLAPGLRCFQSGDGACQLPVFAHFGEAFSAFVRDPGRVTAELAAIKAAGYDGIRFWDTLGYYQMVWHGKEIMPWAFTVCTDRRFPECDGHTVPATPDYYGQLRAFLRAVQAAGLTTHHSRGDLNGQGTSRIVAHAEQVARIYDEIGWEVVSLFEGNNEDWQNGDFQPDGLRGIVAPAAGRGALTALSAPPNSSEEPDAIHAYAASVFYVHGLRAGIVDILRHIFSMAREQAEGTPRLGWQGEPAGPGSGVSGGQVNDPEALAWMAAQSLLSRQAWVYMSGHGVFYTGPIAGQPGFLAVPRVAARLEAFAPEVMSFHLTHGGARDAALTSPTGFWGDPGVTDGPSRIDQTWSGDGRVVALVYGGGGAKRVRNVTGRALDCAVLSVADDEALVEHAVRLEAGADLGLDYRVGRLLLCR